MKRIAANHDFETALVVMFLIFGINYCEKVQDINNHPQPQTTEQRGN